MTTDVDMNVIARVAGDIVVALLAQRPIEPDEIPGILLNVRQALVAQIKPHQPLRAAPDAAQTTAAISPPERGVALRPLSGPASARSSSPVPAVPVAESIYPDRLISLEDGKPYRSLRRHLMAKYGLTPDQYRKKWGLPPDYPMVAPDYAKARSEVARRIGLGRARPRVKPPRSKRA